MRALAALALLLALAGPAAAHPTDAVFDAWQVLEDEMGTWPETTNHWLTWGAGQSTYWEHWTNEQANQGVWGLWEQLPSGLPF
jgi:hypothetical protein